MPKAQVVYKTFKNATGEVKVPVRFEYPNGFTEDRLLSDIKEFNNHIVDKYRQLSAKTLCDLNIMLDNAFLKTKHRTAEDLANYYDENSIDLFDRNMYYYRCFQNGKLGECRFIAGTTYCLLRNLGLTDCYVMSIRSLNLPNHAIVVYRVSEDKPWRVFPCVVNYPTEDLPNLTLDKFLLGLKNGYISETQALDLSIAIQPPVSSTDACYPRAYLDRAHPDGKYPPEEELMNALLTEYNSFFPGLLNAECPKGVDEKNQVGNEERTRWCSIC